MGGVTDDPPARAFAEPDELTLNNVRYRVISTAAGPFMRADRKGQINGIGYLSVEAA